MVSFTGAFPISAREGEAKFWITLYTHFSPFSHSLLLKIFHLGLKNYLTLDLNYPINGELVHPK